MDYESPLAIRYEMPVTVMRQEKNHPFSDSLKHLRNLWDHNCFYVYHRSCHTQASNECITTSAWVNIETLFILANGCSWVNGPMGTLHLSPDSRMLLLYSAIMCPFYIMYLYDVFMLHNLTDVFMQFEYYEQTVFNMRQNPVVLNDKTALKMSFANDRHFNSASIC